MGLPLRFPLPNACNGSMCKMTTCLDLAESLPLRFLQ